MSESREIIHGWGYWNRTSNVGHRTSDIGKSRFLAALEMTGGVVETAGRVVGRRFGDRRPSCLYDSEIAAHLVYMIWRSAAYLFLVIPRVVAESTEKVGA